MSHRSAAGPVVARGEIIRAIERTLTAENIGVWMVIAVMEFLALTL